MLLLNQFFKKEIIISLEICRTWLAHAYLKCSCLWPKLSILNIPNHSFFNLMIFDSLYYLMMSSMSSFFAILLEIKLQIGSFPVRSAILSILKYFERVLLSEFGLRLPKTAKVYCYRKILSKLIY